MSPFSLLLRLIPWGSHYYYPVKNWYEECLELLSKGANPNVENKYGWSFYMICLRNAAIPNSEHHVACEKLVEWLILNTYKLEIVKNRKLSERVLQFYKLKRDQMFEKIFSMLSTLQLVLVPKDDLNKIIMSFLLPPALTWKLLDNNYELDTSHRLEDMKNSEYIREVHFIS